MNIEKRDLIAVVGASSDESKYGHKIFRDLLGAGYNVVPINPKAKKILNRKVYANLSELEEIPELLIIVVPPEITEKIVKQAQKAGVKKIWMQPGSESEKAIEISNDLGIELVHDACFMISEKIW